jgi:hypothetical protein
VEVRFAQGAIELRDTTGTVVRFSDAEWAAFVAGVKHDEFDV